VNHSCHPNCRAEEERGRVWISALRNIKAGEELTYDYALKNRGSVAMPCHCGARNCRGSMFSREELKRRGGGQVEDKNFAPRSTKRKARTLLAKHQVKSHG
jgi:hypothetical protein